MSVLAAFVALLLLPGAAVQLLPQTAPGQPRDPRAAPTTGTGVIKGRVTAADTGAPFRRAVVALIGGTRPRSVYTNDDGRYVFEGVLPGSYSVSANPGMHRANYRQSSHGVDPSRSGFAAVPTRIRVADGQVLENIDIAIPRSGVIVGRVVDPYGEPAARIQVRLMMLRPGQEPMQSGPGASTDDLGQFRIFGVAPGDYLVLADAQPGGPGEVEGERLGFARTFAPGVHSPGEGARVRVGPGTEAMTEIRLLETAVFNVRGTVLNSQGEPVRNASAMLMRTDFMASGSGSGTDQSGAFNLRNVTPGSYELVIQYQPPGARPGPNGQMEGREMASMRVDVSTADIDGLQLVTTPGATVRGQIVFEDAPPAGMRVQLNILPAQMRSFGPPGAIEVKEEAFTATGVFGPVLIRGNVVGTGPRPVTPAGTPRPVWSLKEVLLNGKDITDVPTVFTGAQSGALQVVFTSRTASVEGRVVDEAGQPVRGAMLMAFSADEEYWTYGSSRVRGGLASGDNGEFTVRGLRAGRYYVIAMQSTAPIGGGPSGPDREFLKMLKGAATEVLLNENDTRAVDLRVVRIE